MSGNVGIVVCASKISHRTELAARKRCEQLLNRRGHLVRPYFCPYCSRWHVARITSNHAAFPVGTPVKIIGRHQWGGVRGVVSRHRNLVNGGFVTVVRIQSDGPVNGKEIEVERESNLRRLE